MKRNFFDKAIRLISGDCAYDTDGKTILVWKTPDISQPSQTDIDAKIAELQAAYNAQAYARSRQAEYPPLAEQLDHIYHNGVASWKANMVKPVKDKYPKP